MNPKLEINGRLIGNDYTPLVIAEIGINHEGSLITAKEMVDAAFKAGAEVIKHQTHIVEDEMSSVIQQQPFGKTHNLPPRRKGRPRPVSIHGIAQSDPDKRARDDPRHQRPVILPYKR